MESIYFQAKKYAPSQCSLRESIEVPLINTEKILNRPITKFYNSDDVNVIVAELRLTKERPTSFHKT